MDYDDIGIIIDKIDVRNVHGSGSERLFDISIFYKVVFSNLGDCTLRIDIERASSIDAALGEAAIELACCLSRAANAARANEA
ncbi:hypothetical protein [Rhodomicrobium lacus]|uniref:hypothetical protein n=1 Tax=Rhodomicrobium lacus TaxID=2498452 RepID=UPI000F8ED38F|nr:hypothetical protein [Rhodomicrobium lacus]